MAVFNLVSDTDSCNLDKTTEETLYVHELLADGLLCCLLKLLESMHHEWSKALVRVSAATVTEGDQTVVAELYDWII